jgi:DNA-directed RNA polymerase subunit RPC12/RpoP
MIVEFDLQLVCLRCGETFPVHLNRVRARSGIVCPACESACLVSEDQAIRAHRRLEELEVFAKISGP